jgi:hypothetical protein
VIVHVGPVPVEEILASLAGAGTVLVLARAWIYLRVLRRGVPRA